MKYRILIVLLMIFFNGCAGRSTNSIKELEGYNNNNKYIGKNITCSSMLLLDDYFINTNKINGKMACNSNSPMTIMFISNDNSHFLARAHSKMFDYFVIPYSYLADGKIRFLDIQTENEQIELIKSKLVNSKEATVELIDEIIMKIPKVDNFRTQIENDKTKEFYLNKFGIIKTTVYVKSESYNSEKKMWAGSAVFGTKKLKQDQEDHGTYTGSNAFGVVAKYSSSKFNDWTVYWDASFPQSPEEARNTKSITIYGTIKNAEIDGHYKEATLDSPYEFFMYNHRIDLNVIIGEAIFNDGSSKILLPVSSIY